MSRKKKKVWEMLHRKRALNIFFGFETAVGFLNAAVMKLLIDKLLGLCIVFYPSHILLFSCKEETALQKPQSNITVFFLSMCNTTLAKQGNAHL